MERTITTAQSEYYKRPADERYPTVAALVDAAEYDRTHSAERVYNLRDLEAVVVDAPQLKIGQPGDCPGKELRLQSPTGNATLTHYAFGQLARTIGAPASYLRTLPPELAAANLNHGLHEAAPVGTTANLLVKANGGTPVIRACTSETYGRVWDGQLFGETLRHFNPGTGYTLPPTWDGKPAGAYRGDRDSFLILVNGGSIVTDPTLRNGSTRQTSTDGSTEAGAMFRGIMLRNSEVGHCSITIETVLYRYICGNHCLWGAMIDRTFRRRHVGARITRDTMAELNTLAWKWTRRAASDDERIIRGLIDHEIAHTKEAVIDELKKMGATKEQATDAYATCEIKEQASPRSFWGLAQGLTRNSQESGWQDERLQLDQLAAAVLKRGAALVTV